MADDGQKGNPKKDKDYGRAEQNYNHMLKYATHGTSFNDKHGYVRMQKKPRPTSKKSGSSSRTKKSVHQPPANTQEVDAGRALVATFKHLYSIRPEESLNDRRVRLTEWCVGHGALQKWPDFHQRCVKSQMEFDKMEVLTPTTNALPSNQRSDFIETSDLPGASGHGEQRDFAVGGLNPPKMKRNGHGEQVFDMNVITKFPKRGVRECPNISRRYDLVYSWAETFPISCIDARCIHHPRSATEDCGVVVKSKNEFGVMQIHGFRWPRRLWLNAKEQKLHFSLCDLQQKCREYLERGADCASLCVSFSALGFKWDRDTGNQSMYTDRGGNATKANNARHAGTSTQPQKPANGGKERAQYMGAVRGMRSFAEKVLYPRLQEIFFLETAVVELFWELHGVHSFAAIWSSITSGGMFMPRGHTDKDLIPSNLVCSDRRPKKEKADSFDSGVLGGDWSFPGTGHVLKSLSGAIFTYMPWMQHCTTRYAIEKSCGTNPFRYYSAFYGKEAVVRGAGTVIEVSKRKFKRESRSKSKKK